MIKVPEDQWVIEDLARMGQKLDEFSADPFNTVPEKRLLLRFVSEAVRRFEVMSERTVT